MSRTEESNHKKNEEERGRCIRQPEAEEDDGGGTAENFSRKKQIEGAAAAVRHMHACSYFEVSSSRASGRSVVEPCTGPRPCTDGVTFAGGPWSALGSNTHTHTVYRTMKAARKQQQAALHTVVDERVVAVCITTT